MQQISKSQDLDKEKKLPQAAEIQAATGFQYM